MSPPGHRTRCAAARRWRAQASCTISASAGSTSGSPASGYRAPGANNGSVPSPNSPHRTSARSASRTTGSSSTGCLPRLSTDAQGECAGILIGRSGRACSGVGLRAVSGFVCDVSVSVFGGRGILGCERRADLGRLGGLSGRGSWSRVLALRLSGACSDSHRGTPTLAPAGLALGQRCSRVVLLAFAVFAATTHSNRITSRTH